MPLQPHQLLDALPETKKYFKRRLMRADIDFKSFAKPMQLCSLENCSGQCCYDGVCVDEDEERYLTAILEAHPVFFKSLKLKPENAFEDATFLDTDTRKTQARKMKYPKQAKLPKHFDSTRCCFRYEDGRCSLQSLAMEHGEHPWAYKPFSCWLHPISLERGNKTVLWIPDHDTDHLTTEDYPGYAPYTPCGACVKGGKPGYEIMKSELQALGAIVGRDFYGEIVAHFSKKQKAKKSKEKQ